MKCKDQKFWARIHKTSSKSACWVWPGSKDRYGYGRVVRVQFGKKPLKAHRYAFFLHYGRWPEGFCSPACGNKSCVRPKHLYDAIRLAQMEKPVMMDEYLEGVVLEMQKKYVKGSRIYGMSALASDYGFDIKTISQMIQGTFLLII